MDKTTQVQLNEKWWKDNQPRTLKDKGKLGVALKNFDSHWKLAQNAKGPTKLGCLEQALAALNAIDMAAKKNSAACVKGAHDGAKHVLGSGPINFVAVIPPA
ncbi:hypothetical protein [Ruegeria jejuensis]|uniref:hypothetical protein n=1 Tax=Ruegeria jejuensis TaxID=3233338 RepID=UPI00355C7A70